MALTQERLKRVLTYDRETGVFRWQERDDVLPRWNTRYAGKIAGCSNESAGGAIVVGIDGVSYLAHRLAFLFETGAWPDPCADHINCVRNDNRWANLRECSRAENNRNVKRKSNNTSGFKGVYLHRKSGKWQAKLIVGGKQAHLGLYHAKDEAAAAYDRAALKLHGEFARLNEAAR